MNWEAIGAIGEILGAVGVIVSLFYVAYQVRQSTNQGKLNTIAIESANFEALSAAANDIRLRLAENPELARLYLKGSKNPTLLSDEETLGYRMFLDANVSNYYLSYESKRRGVNDDWESAHSYILRLLNSPGGKWYWEISRSGFNVEFQKAIDDLLAEHSE